MKKFRKTTNTTLTVEPLNLYGNLLDVHHEVTLTADAPGIHVLTYVDAQGEDADGETVWVDLNDVVDNLLDYEDFEEFVIDEWIVAMQEQIEKMQLYKLRLLEKENG